MFPESHDQSDGGMFISVQTEQQIETVEALARSIWTEHYIPLIGKEQVEYMLCRFQSKEAIVGQIRNGQWYFLVMEKDQPVGYVSVQPRKDELFLSKLYVVSSKRNSGFGRKTVYFCQKLAQERHLNRISLTVNKRNQNSINAYLRFGFKNQGPVLQDIGNGFVMDDYKMEKVFTAGDR